MGDLTLGNTSMGFVTTPHLDVEYDNADGARAAAKRADNRIFIVLCLSRSLVQIAKRK